MPINLTMLERKIPNNLNCVYLLDHPVYHVSPDKRLTVAKEYADAGTVTAITQTDDQRIRIDFSDRNELILTAKKVFKLCHTADAPSCQQLLHQMGYRLPLKDMPTTTAAGSLSLDCPIMPATPLESLPSHYIVIDCEFGNLFRRTSATNTINWQIFKYLGLKTNVFQLSAISFNRDQQTGVFFNRFFDNPYFLPEKKLTGLAETGLTLPAYEQQGQPLAIIKSFIAQVLAPGLPLVFWDQTQDTKYLRKLLTAYFAELTHREQTVLTAPISVFDAQAFVNTLINEGNHKNGLHDLPLNGLAALFDISNPHQHNALWDVQTTQLVMQKIRHLCTQPIQSTPQPRPLQADYTNQQTRQAKYALVHALHAHGKTYREIAAVTGVSVSGVNYILKKAAELPDHSLVL